MKINCYCDLNKKNVVYTYPAEMFVMLRGD